MAGIRSWAYENINTVDETTVAPPEKKAAVSRNTNTVDEAAVAPLESQPTISPNKTTVGVTVELNAAATGAAGICSGVCENTNTVDKTALSFAARSGPMMLFVPHADTASPRDTDSGIALKIIDAWHYLFSNKKQSVIDYLTTKCNEPGNNKGVRTINGGRFELFLDPNDEKGTEAIDWVCREARKLLIPSATAIKTYTPENMRRLVIAFANSQAQKEKRMIGALRYTMKSHALIVSFGKVKAQDMHIDLEDPKHFQFGLICSPKVPATLEFKATGAVIGGDHGRDGLDLRTVWDSIPEMLAVKIRDHPDCQFLLKSYGVLLSKCVKVPFVASKGGSKKGMPLGSLLSLPGGVPHAGPATTGQGVRAILFFTGAPSDSPGYDVESQYCRTTLIGDIIMHAWFSMTAKEREYLLTRWFEAGISKDGVDALDCMGNRALLTIGRAIKKERKADKRLLLIRAIANDPWWKEENREGMDSVWDEKDALYKLPNLAEQQQEMTADPTSTLTSRANDGDMAHELVAHSGLPPDERDPPIMDMAMRNISGDAAYPGEASAGAETVSSYFSQAEHFSSMKYRSPQEDDKVVDVCHVQDDNKENHARSAVDHEGEFGMVCACAVHQSTDQSEKADEIEITFVKDDDDDESSSILVVEGPQRANRENILCYEGDEAYDDTMFDYSAVVVSRHAVRAAARIYCLKYPPDKEVMARLKRTMKGHDNDEISSVSYKTMDDSDRKSEVVIRHDFTKCLIAEGDFVNDAIVRYYRALLNRRDYVTHGEDLPRRSWIFDSFVACLIGMKDKSKVHDGLTAQVPGKVQQHCHGTRQPVT
jgi:hypothetical protein